MITSKFKIATFSIALSLSAMAFQGCDSLTKTQKGAGIGAAAGGVLGAIIGKKAGNTAIGAILGGAIGGTAGGFIGKRMDKQAAEIQNAIPNAEVVREGEGIIVKFDSGILFDFDSANLKAQAKDNVKSLAGSLEKYPDTEIKVIGHTDSKGTETYNMSLSERRAAAVKAYAVSQGVPSGRMTTVGKGFSEPIADNATDAGRAANRRVEIVIVANDQLKKQAQQANN
ncbi:outer membrane protein OmpA-like peptidoglycan-associated protein [Pedobacter cryoconitis]|uniref:Outer membrane protein OmpA-like peptidoglycan-associated protein n=1 Tax=Pedobacter cryoconitis TaxID=188932 RepID=A0A7W9DY73_9SPHI|nr:OmpA family protein [Pedobacter cryoconitis]MBB5635693.1 outer membrane protein OmpA-like peptidoglycan-associated protein [Pedobacter cryoconitis]MBB6273433.1 outer membrane protein OmpA-like peptidoglycan-associated protein [Pedobacter cryoconitis]